jgi:hypothetical protein
MKRITAVAGLTALLLTIAVSSLHAQRGQRRGMMMGNYDPKTEITIQGSVEKIDRLNYGNMPGMGIHLTVRSGNEITNVHLGPAPFVDKAMTLKEGDTIQVTGSKVTMMGKAALIAREIKKDDHVLKLRDANGVPLWSRGARRPS